MKDCSAAVKTYEIYVRSVNAEVCVERKSWCLRIGDLAYLCAIFKDAPLSLGKYMAAMMCGKRF